MFQPNEGALLALWLGESFTKEKYTLCYVILMTAVALLSYLLGSLNSPIFVSKLVYRKDIRALGTREATFGNVYRVFGVKAAALSALGDVLKTALAVAVGGFAVGFYYFRSISISEGCYLAGFFCIIGHTFPLFNRFQGEKNAFCLAAVCAALAPIPFVLLFLLYLGVLATGKYLSLAAVTCAVLFPVMINGVFKIFGFPEPGLVAVSTIFSAVVTVGTHFENLQRISDQTEPKFRFSMLKELGRKKAEESSPAEQNRDGN